jgi:hypothetical protein
MKRTSVVRCVVLVTVGVLWILWRVWVMEPVPGDTPRPGEWWQSKMYRSRPHATEGPWSVTGQAHPDVQFTICCYVRAVQDGWVRYVQNALFPDERMPVEAFMSINHRVTAPACAGTSAWEFLRCPPTHFFAGVTDDHQPRCLPLAGERL